MRQARGANRVPPQKRDQVKQTVQGGQAHWHHEPVRADRQRGHQLVPGVNGHRRGEIGHYGHQYDCNQRAQARQHAPGRCRNELHQQFNAHVRTFAKSERYCQEHAPDKQQPGDFIGPVDRGIERVAKQYLNRYHDDHQRRAGNDQPARCAVKPRERRIVGSQHRLKAWPLRRAHVRPDRHPRAF